MRAMRTNATNPNPEPLPALRLVGSKRPGVPPARDLALTPVAERALGIVAAVGLREHLAACHRAGRILPRLAPLA